MFTEEEVALIKFALTYVQANIDHAGEFASNNPDIGSISEEELEKKLQQIKDKHF